jgi:phage protein U
MSAYTSAGTSIDVLPPIRKGARQVERRRTSVNDPVRMKVLDGAEDGSDELRGVVFEEIRFGADSVEELTALAEVGDEVDCN